MNGLRESFLNEFTFPQLNALQATIINTRVITAPSVLRFSLQVTTMLPKVNLAHMPTWTLAWLHLSSFLH